MRLLTREDQAKAHALGLTDAEALMSAHLGLSFEAYAKNKAKPEDPADVEAQKKYVLEHMASAAGLTAEERVKFRADMGLPPAEGQGT